MKKLLAILICTVVLLSCVSCFSPVEKAFSTSGMTITLTSNFKETTLNGYTVAYDSTKVAVFVLKENFSLLEGFEDYSLEQYGEILRQNNESKNPSELKEIDNITYFEYQFHNTELDKDYKYFTTVYKSSDAFWMIQFCSLVKDYESQFDNMLTWAKSVEFEK